MTKVKAIRFSQTGGPEVLHLAEVDLPPPGKGEVTVRHAAIGLNYIDTYHRSGLYPVSLPSGIGLEASGTVEAVGESVAGFKPGDRVAYGTGTVGAYSQMRNYPANRLVKIPDSIGDEAAAAMMLKGMTARYLLRATYKVQPGDVILFHAAAGGVGLIAVQWAKALGATVIGTVGSPEKAELARAHGCDHVINYRKEDVAKRVREITGGVGVPVVYDGVGAATVTASLDSLRIRGLLVSFGNASGPVRNFDRHPVDQGLALCHAADSVLLCRHRCRVHGDRRRPDRHGGKRQGQDRGQPAPSSGRCRQGASRARIARDHRLDDSAPIGSGQ